MFKSIRIRLTLWYTFVVIAILLTFGITTYFYVRETLRDNLDLSLRNEIGYLNDIMQKKYPNRMRRLPQPSIGASDSSEVIDVTDPTWKEIYEHTLLNPRKQFFQVSNKKGVLLFHSQTLGTDTLKFPQPLPNEYRIQVVTTQGIRDIFLRMAAVRTSEYIIIVAYPLAELGELLDNLFSIFVLIGPVAVILSLAGGWFLANKSLRPVDEITTAARRITAENLEEKIPSHGTDDELGRLVSTFNDMISRLRDSFVQVKQFSMDASHELRTPLTIMRGEIEMVLRGRRPPEEYRQVLTSSLEEIMRMASIIENLLTLSKAERGTTEIHRESLQLDQIVLELFEDSAILASKKNITVDLRHVDEITINGDKIRLRQLLLNLLDNAIKFTPENGRVTLELIRRNGEAQIIVTDSGIGIPEEDLPRIFDRFYRVEKGRSREMGGSGLGLAIAQWVVQAHNGSIEVQSQPHKGTTFTVHLPC